MSDFKERNEHFARAIADAQVSYIEAERAACDLEAENRKLRELVRIAVKYCDSGTCDGCPIMGDDESCPYSDMARELGVEAE